MDLLNIAVIGFISAIGGVVTFFGWRLKQRFVRIGRAEADPSIEPEDDEASSGDGFPDLPAPLTFDSEQTSEVDIAAEFASAHKTLREIAKAQVTLIEAQHANDSSDMLKSVSADLESVKTQAEQLRTTLDQGLKRLDEALLNNDTGLTTDDRMAEVLNVLNQIQSRSSEADVPQLADHVLSQITSLSEDVSRLTSHVASSAKVSERLDGVEHMLHQLLTPPSQDASAERLQSDSVAQKITDVPEHHVKPNGVSDPTAGSPRNPLPVHDDGNSARQGVSYIPADDSSNTPGPDVVESAYPFEDRLSDDRLSDDGMDKGSAASSEPESQKLEKV